MEEDAFIKEIHQVAEQGYALNKGEYEDGVCSIAVPVRNGSGNIAASMNIVVPETRFSNERQKELLDLLLERRRTSRRFGDTRRKNRKGAAHNSAAPFLFP